MRSRIGDWRDYEATKECLASGRLTEDELELLHDRHYIFSLGAHSLMSLERELAHAIGKPVGAREVSGYVREVAEHDWREWLERVLSSAVEIAPAFAVVRRGDDRYRIEINWLFDRKGRTHRIKSVRVVADDFLRAWETPLVGEHLAAFALHVGRLPPKAAARTPRSQPLPGQPTNTDFYRRLLRSYEALLKEGEYRYPAAELARRMDKNPSTVRTWLKRARDLDLEKGP